MFQSRMLKVENPKNTLEHAQEDPEIRETFEEELAKRGMDSQIPEEAYEQEGFVPDEE